jgi:hypothetical protein
MWYGHSLPAMRRHLGWISSKMKDSVRRGAVDPMHTYIHTPKPKIFARIMLRLNNRFVFDVTSKLKDAGMVDASENDVMEDDLAAVPQRGNWHYETCPSK